MCPNRLFRIVSTSVSAPTAFVSWKRYRQTSEAADTISTAQADTHRCPRMNSTPPISSGRTDISPPDSGSFPPSTESTVNRMICGLSSSNRETSEVRTAASANQRLLPRRKMRTSPAEVSEEASRSPA